MACGNGIAVSFYLLILHVLTVYLGTYIYRYTDNPCYEHTRYKHIFVVSKLYFPRSRAYAFNESCLYIYTRQIPPPASNFLSPLPCQLLPLRLLLMTFYYFIL